MDEISVEKARPKLGDLVRDARRHGAMTRITLNGKRAAVLMPDRTQLTDFDRLIIARSRELADAWTTDSLRPIIGRDAGTDGELVRTEALGVARKLLGDLAAIIDRLDGHD
jgi:prevent-host-death family protein